MHWTRKLRQVAHSRVKWAIKCGELPAIDEDTKCVDCDAPAQCYDHRDYRKPLDVEPVCTRCNNVRGPGLPLPKGEDRHSSVTPYLITRYMGNAGAGVATDSDAISVDVCRVSDFRMEDSLKLAFHDLNKYRNPLTNGDLRSEYFKRHDPLFEENLMHELMEIAEVH